MADLPFSHGKHETQRAQQDIDRHRHFQECRNNPGHLHFIPVKEFGLAHLPPDYNDNNIVKFILTHADLTVRIEATTISNKRPEIWPESALQVQYPFYQSNESSVLRFGTGRIQTLNKYTKDLNISCRCSKCQNSEEPSKYWAEIRIHTAAHTVFDNAEGESARCTLFFDNEDGPKVVLSNCYVEMSYADRDRSRLVFATCNSLLIRKVSKLLKRHYKLWRLLYRKYERNQAKNKLTVIVSHPHGCAKRVTVGDWLGRYTFGKSSSKYTYTTDTCEGSSGAPVYRLGNGGWHERVHCGVQETEFNYNSTGLGRPTFSEIHFPEIKYHLLDVFILLLLFIIYSFLSRWMFSELPFTFSFLTSRENMNYQQICWFLIFLCFQDFLLYIFQKSPIFTSNTNFNLLFRLFKSDPFESEQHNKHVISRPCFVLFVVFLLITLSV